MHKLLFFTIVCLAIGLILASEHKDRQHMRDKNVPYLSNRHHSMNRKASKFCSNSTTAQAYLTEIISVVDTLQANSSYSSILNLQTANFITYLKNTVNQALLRSDCEAFIKGLTAAEKADQVVERTQKHLAATIRTQLKQVARDVTNGKGFYELDT